MFRDCPQINYLKEDTLGNYWYVSGESLGAILIDKNGQYKKLQSIFSNLTGDLVDNYLSINTIDQNNILIGTTNGLANFDSTLLSNIESKPKVFIRSFTFANDTIIHGNPQDKIHENIIPYAKNNVKFTFSSPEYENSHNITFSYRLDAFDSNWSNWLNNSMKEYTNLREGCYIMQVKARNSYGMESDIKSLDFTITPPWYRNYWAYFSYVILFALLAYLISLMAIIKI